MAGSARTTPASAGTFSDSYRILRHGKWESLVMCIAVPTAGASTGSCCPVGGDDTAAFVMLM